MITDDIVILRINSFSVYEKQDILLQYGMIV